MAKLNLQKKIFGYIFQLQAKEFSSIVPVAMLWASYETRFLIPPIRCSEFAWEL